MGAFTGGLAGGAVVTIVINAIDKASPILKGVNKSMLAVGASITAIGVVGISAMSNLAKEASNLEESANAVNVVFGAGAKVIEEFGKTSAKSVGMAQSEFNQMSAVTGALLKDVGLPMEEVAGLTNDLTVRASDLASVFNTDVSDAMSAINQALRGETEAIRRYAGDVTDATLESYLLSIGIKKSVKELTQEEKRLYRVQLIMKQTANVAGDFANTSDSLANRQRILGATIKDLKSDLGTSLLPAFESIIGVVMKAVDWFSGLSDNAKKWIVWITAGAIALALIIGPLLIIIALLPALIAGFGALSIIFSPITLSILAIVAGIALLVAGSILLWKNWEKLGTKTKILIGIFFPFIALPIAIIKNWDTLKVAMAEIWNSVVSSVQWGVNKVISFLNVLVRAYNRIRGKVGLSQIGEIGNINLGGAMLDVGAMEAKILAKNQPLPTSSINNKQTTVNIENIYGTDPTDISQALSNELNTKVTL